jgi:hypothetical protein
MGSFVSKEAPLNEETWLARKPQQFVLCVDDKRMGERKLEISWSPQTEEDGTLLDDSYERMCKRYKRRFKLKFPTEQVPWLCMCDDGYGQHRLLYRMLYTKEFNHKEREKWTQATSRLQGFLRRRLCN